MRISDWSSDVCSSDLRVLHRHGGIVETILEREADARVVVIGKRGASQEFATDHIGSKIERVVRASAKPILIAARAVEPPKVAVLAYDGSPPASRELERCANPPLFAAPGRAACGGQVGRYV